MLAPFLEQCSSVQASLEFCTKFVFYVFCVTWSCILLAPLLGGAQIIVSILTLVSFSMGFFSVLFVLCESGRTDFIHLSCCTPDLKIPSVFYMFSVSIPCIELFIHYRYSETSTSGRFCAVLPLTGIEHVIHQACGYVMSFDCGLLNVPWYLLSFPLLAHAPSLVFWSHHLGHLCSPSGSLRIAQELCCFLTFLLCKRFSSNSCHSFMTCMTQ